MEKIWKILNILIMIGFISFIIINSCKKEPQNYYNQEIKELTDKIDSLNGEARRINLTYPLIINKIEQLKENDKLLERRLKNEIKNLDKLFENESDTLFVNSVIRYWADRLNRLLQQDTINN